ncbi:MAG: hypothetical protein JW724_04740 [Candidatus Altiarchaeota archaeon]|nr:hypothetical protein [Candidatus Altiarchaeota archaeon]
MKNMVSDKWFRIAASLVIVMLALLYLAGPDKAVSVGWSVMVVFLLLIYLRRKYPDRYQKDERITRIGAYAASYSWFATFLIVSLLYWMDYLGYLKMTGAVALSIVFALMAFTIIFFRWFFSLKGDVQ